MDTTSSFIKSVTKRVWSPPQRPFRVCCHDRGTRKGITAGTLEELKERALRLSLSAVSLSLVCEEDGTEVDSEEFLITLPDNTTLMALEPRQTWTPQPVRLTQFVSKSQEHNKPRTGRDIARVTFDLYRISPKDVFGSLNVKATFQGLYSVSANFECLGPKKVLREALRVASTLLHAAGHLLITSASMIRRIIEGAELWHPQRTEYTASLN
uniref:Cell death inducing DFFA like effector b n=1 Tax=Cyclopterus lumpus TaxID=8103 RepID=A0A8C2X594_CYCLU